jgi:hypothetical protein
VEKTPVAVAAYTFVDESASTAIEEMGPPVRLLLAEFHDKDFGSRRCTDAPTAAYNTLPRLLPDITLAVEPPRRARNVAQDTPPSVDLARPIPSPNAYNVERRPPDVAAIPVAT